MIHSESSERNDNSPPWDCLQKVQRSGPKYLERTRESNYHNIHTFYHAPQAYTQQETQPGGFVNVILLIGVEKRQWKHKKRREPEKRGSKLKHAVNTGSYSCPSTA